MGRVTEYDIGNGVYAPMECYIEEEEVVISTPIEIDDELGLPLVAEETIKSKYGIDIDLNNSFHCSLNDFFGRAGFLTDPQLRALRKRVKY